MFLTSMSIFSKIVLTPESALVRDAFRIMRSLNFRGLLVKQSVPGVGVDSRDSERLYSEFYPNLLC